MWVTIKQEKLFIPTEIDMPQEQKPKKTGWMTTFLRGLAIFFLIMAIYYFAKAWL